MLKSLNHIRIITSCVTIFFCMLTASIVFAKGEEVVTKKSYYIPPAANNEYVEKPIELVSKLEKQITTGQAYEVEIVDGNVIQKNIINNHETKIYNKGNAKYLAEINYYYYDSHYILIVTENGDLYANIYKNNVDQVVFHKVETDFDIINLKVIEKDLKVYEYPGVQLYGEDSEGNWKEIKL